MDWETPEAAAWDVGRANLATPGKRFLGFLVDALVLFVVAMVIFLTSIDIDSFEPTDPLPASVLWTLQLLAAGYYIILTALRGQTLGKMAVKTQVANMDTGTIPTWGQAIIRWAVPALIGLIPQIGFLSFVVYLWLVWDKLNQGLHDKAARTVVIDLDVRGV